MNNKTNKKQSAAVDPSKDAIAKAMSILADKVLFPKKVEQAKQYMRNAKMKTS